MSGEKRSRAERGECVYTGLGGRRPRVLAHGGASKRSLTTDEAHLYWIAEEDGELTRLRKGGGVPVVLANAPRGRALTYAEGWLYWAQPGSWIRRERGSVLRMPREGGTPEVLLRDLSGPSCLTISGAQLAIGCDGEWNDDFLDQEHWASRGSVLRATVGESGAAVVASEQRGPCSLLFAGDELYWANHGYKRSQYFADGSIVRAGRGAPEALCGDQAMACSLIADDHHVYWTTAATVHAPVPYRRGGIHRLPKSGGAVETIHEWDRERGHLALDATHFYWMDHSRGALYRLPKEGGEPEPMMTCSERLILCDGIVLDDQFVYWTVWDPRRAGGAVWCIAKDPPRLGQGSDPPPLLH